jgi:hypothetical protein
MYARGAYAKERRISGAVIVSRGGARCRTLSGIPRAVTRSPVGRYLLLPAALFPYSLLFSHLQDTAASIPEIIFEALVPAASTLGHAVFTWYTIDCEWVFTRSVIMRPPLFFVAVNYDRTSRYYCYDTN